jgi:hypothetical protein
METTEMYRTVAALSHEMYRLVGIMSQMGAEGVLVLGLCFILFGLMIAHLLWPDPFMRIQYWLTGSTDRVVIQRAALLGLLGLTIIVISVIASIF